MRRCYSTTTKVMAGSASSVTRSRKSATSRGVWLIKTAQNANSGSESRLIAAKRDIQGEDSGAAGSDSPGTATQVDPANPAPAKRQMEATSGTSYRLPV